MFRRAVGNLVAERVRPVQVSLAALVGFGGGDPARGMRI